jgi:RimJ/RimL family protein N-acetyltransferase
MNITDKVFSKKEITLQVLNQDHFEPLAELAMDIRIWKHGPHSYSTPEEFKKHWLNKTLKQMSEQKRIAFVIYKNQHLIGSTSYYAIDVKNKKIKIGYTWLQASQWGSTANALSKLILLEHAFETMQLNRIEFSIDEKNTHSCQSLEKFGIHREGVLRNDMVLLNGETRDSVIYSIIPNEWQHIKKNLETFIEGKS